MHADKNCIRSCDAKIIFFLSWLKEPKLNGLQSRLAKSCKRCNSVYFFSQVDMVGEKTRVESLKVVSLCRNRIQNVFIIRIFLTWLNEGGIFVGGAGCGEGKLEKKRCVCRSRPNSALRKTLLPA